MIKKRKLRLDQLVPLNVCSAKEVQNGDWSLLLWIDRTSWWVGDKKKEAFK